MLTEMDVAEALKYGVINGGLQVDAEYPYCGLHHVGHKRI
jgi:hypothetical protein